MNNKTLKHLQAKSKSKEISGSDSLSEMISKRETNKITPLPKLNLYTQEWNEKITDQLNQLHERAKENYKRIIENGCKPEIYDVKK